MFDLTTTISTVSGYLSIVTWLGAQLPQTYTNYVLKSVDGLAWPFLLNWLLGDACNLVGCLLTDQLPFQTWLASYFVFVDLTLCGQFVWYNGRGRKDGEKGGERERERERERESVSRTRRGLTEEDPLLASSTLVGTAEEARRRRSHSLDPSSYNRTLSALASSIAFAAAAVAADEEQHQHQHQRQRHNTSAVVDEPGLEQEQEGDEQEQEQDRMIASFYSEHGRIGRRGRSVALVSPRSHSYYLPGGDGTQQQPQAQGLDRSVSTTRSGGRRHATAGVVFLAFVGLFGLGTSPIFRSSSSYPSSVGQVLSPRPPHPPSDDRPFPIPFSISPPFIHPSPNAFTLVSSPATPDSPTAPKPPPPNTSAPDRKRIIGRISAWICTTLYLTSRMPQMWKNFVRRSTQGLSPYLFLFAFLGNFFYVVSILANPLARPSTNPNGWRAFLMESLPYILGSGGVLTGDIIILGQWWAYRGRKPRAHRQLSHYHVSHSHSQWGTNAQSQSHPQYGYSSIVIPPPHPPPHPSSGTGTSGTGVGRGRSVSISGKAATDTARGSGSAVRGANSERSVEAV